MTITCVVLWLVTFLIFFIKIMHIEQQIANLSFGINDLDKRLAILTEKETEENDTDTD